MPRVWKPLRFFAEEDGVMKPTLLFLIFAVLIGIGVFSGGILIYRDVQGQRFADSVLTGTPTLTLTLTRTPTETPVPSPTLTASPLPSSTPYVYEDPATWELEERTNVHGEIYLDFTREQKDQIEHAFREYYETAWRSLDQPPVLEEVLQYLTGEEYESYKNSYYPEALERDAYIIFPPYEEIGIVIIYSETESIKRGLLCTKIFAVHSDQWVTTQQRISTCEYIRNTNWGDAEIVYVMIFSNGRWKVTKESISYTH